MACVSEPDADDERARFDDVSAAEATLDAGAAPARGDGGARDATSAQSTTLVDASMPTSSPGTDASVCAPGKVLCGTTCIDAIPSTAAALQERVFARSCGLTRSCHAGSAPQAELSLDSLDALLANVGKRAGQASSLSLIEPGKPEASYLMHKLRGTNNAGTAMPPPPSPALCDVKIVAVEAWIRAGAAK